MLALRVVLGFFLGVLVLWCALFLAALLGLAAVADQSYERVIPWLFSAGLVGAVVLPLAWRRRA